MATANIFIFLLLLETIKSAFVSRLKLKPPFWSSVVVNGLKHFIFLIRTNKTERLLLTVLSNFVCYVRVFPDCVTTYYLHCLSHT